MGDVKVNLPPGCSGFDCKDGTKYKADKPGGSVTVSEDHARAINQGQYGQKDFITAKGAQAFGTRRGRWCAPCRRVWNAWNDTCPRCGGVTEEWRR
jgi:hypothetical protein